MLNQDPSAGPVRRTWAALFILVALALLAAGYWYYRSETKTIRRDQFHTIAAIGKLKAGQIQQWRKECLGDAARATDSPFFSREVKAWLATPDAPALREELKKWLIVERRSYEYDNVLLMNREGKILLVAKDTTDPVDPASARAIESALAGHRPVLSDFFRCPHGIVHIDTATPIRDEAGRPIAVLVLRSNAESCLYPLIQFWPTPNGSAETLLVQREGDDIVFLNDLRHRPKTALALRVPLTQTNVPAVQAALGKQGIFEGSDYRGVAVLADLRPIPESPWFMVAKVDSSEILAEARYRAVIIALLVLAFILLTAATIAFAYRRRQARLYRDMYRMEREKAKAREQFRTILYSIGDAVITTDREGRIRQLNTVAERLTGWTEAEGQNRHLEEIFHIVNEHTGAEVENPVARVLREGRIVGLANHTVLIARDGSECPIADSGAPIRDENGALTGVVLVFRDQSRERASQAALRDSEVKYRRLFESAKDGILILNAETGTIVDVNPFLVELLGFSHDQFLGKTLWGLGVFKDIVANHDNFLKLQREGYIRYENIPLETTDGRRIDVEFVSNIYPVNHHKVIQCNIRDITERKQAEKKLRENEGRYRKAQAMGHVGNWEYNLQTNHFWGSDEAKRIYGFDPKQADFSTDEIENCIPERERVHQALVDLIERGKTYNLEFKIIPRNASEPKIIASIAELQRDEHGEPLKVVGVIQDITERKRTEEALRLADVYNRRLIEASLDPLVTIDADGKITDVNAATEKATGYSRVELIGADFSNYFTEPELARAGYEQIFREGQVHDYALDIRRRDGHITPVLYNGSVYRDEAGQIVGVFAAARDITGRKRAEEAMWASEERHRKLFEEATEGIVLADAESGEILNCNRAFLRLSEYELIDVIGKPQTMLHPKEKGNPPVSSTFAQHRSEKKGVVLPAELATKYGTVKQVEIKANVVELDGHTVVQAFFRDVSKELRQQREREMTLELMRLLNDHNSTHELIRDLTGLIRNWTGCDAVGVRLRDGDDYPYFETRGFPADFVEAEKYLCERDATGRPVRDSQGNPVLDCICGNVLCGRFDPALPYFTAKGSFWTNCTTELLANTSEADRQGRTRNRCNGEGYESVALFALHHGDQVLGLLQINDRAKTRFTPETISFLEGLSDQIALALAQRQAQAGLRESEQFNREVIAGAREGVVVYDRDFRYLVWNPFMEEMTGLPASEVLGNVAFDLFPHLRENKVEDLLRRALAGETVHAPDMFFHMERTGKSGWVSCIYSAHYNAQNEIIGVIGIIRDITQRKRAEEEKEKLEAQLRQSQKMESVGKLAGGVAHDFNNMLGVIVGYSEMLLKNLNPSDSIYKDIQEIMKAGQRSADLTRQLLAFARKQTISPKILNINETIAGMLKLLGRLIGEGIELKWKPADNLWPVMMDPAQIDQILANLTVNARDAIAGVGKMTIETGNAEISEAYCQMHLGSAPGHYVLLAASDDGCGMDKETMAHLFEPFFTTKPQGQGTGLGLATVYGIVKQNHGFINVYSEPERGTTFKIFIPRHESVAATIHVAPESAVPQRGTETVLLVEDEKPLLKLGKRLLEELGYTVLAAGSPTQALQLAHEYKGEIHALLTDVVMPKLSGRELQQKLIALRPGLKCLFMSGYTADAIAHQGVLEEGFRFLQKPFTEETLAAKLRETLDESGASSR